MESVNTRIDQSLARGLTKRYLRNCRASQDISAAVINAEMSGKKNFVDRCLRRFEKTMAATLVHKSIQGKRSKRLGGVTNLYPFDVNALALREEDVLYAIDVKIRNDGDAEMLEPRWAISHHAIQRIYERAGALQEVESDGIHRVVLESLLFAPPVAFFFDHFSDIDLLASLDSGEKPREKAFGISLASPFGLFLCELNHEIMVLKTFVATEMLTEEQGRIRTRQIQKLRPYVNTMLPYERSDSSWVVPQNEHDMILTSTKKLALRDMLESSVDTFNLVGGGVENAVMACLRQWKLHGLEDEETYYGQKSHPVGSLVEMLRDVLLANGWDGGIEMFAKLFKKGLRHPAQ